MEWAVVVQYIKFVDRISHSEKYQTSLCLFKKSKAQNYLF